MPAVGDDRYIFNTFLLIKFDDGEDIAVTKMVRTLGLKTSGTICRNCYLHVVTPFKRHL